MWKRSSLCHLTHGMQYIWLCVSMLCYSRPLRGFHFICGPNICWFWLDLEFSWRNLHSQSFPQLTALSSLHKEYTLQSFDSVLGNHSHINTRACKTQDCPIIRVRLGRNQNDRQFVKASSPAWRRRGEPRRCDVAEQPEWWIPVRPWTHTHTHCAHACRELLNAADSEVILFCPQRTL